MATFLRDDRTGQIVETTGKVLGLVLGLGFAASVVLRQHNPKPPPLSAPPRFYIPSPPLPAALRPIAHNDIRVTAAGDGCYHITGYANGVAKSFILDTGATSISLPKSMGAQLGFTGLRYNDGTVATSNGIIGYSRVKIAKLVVGSITLTNVDAIVDEGESDPLLGNTFFARLRGFEVSQGTMTLHP